ncbi:hypothetical protein [Serratia phage vB_SmaM_Hera]|uniref:Uncharacterized protein n=2 Tax=Myosmarvirus MTx TaxID=2846180 RepID=A0A482MI72_9CAUD|nr:hypothetical protein HWC15_gp058 [Serratia phage MTx]QBQ72364.1 hypothetical protein CPT_MTx_058 [Serratia phage MTx]QPX74708.1 hypothetical protein [Serratia phage vB_SmaM_Hera]WLW40858.1 hypothetical protein GNAINCEL_00076 [Serratia phage KKP 3709]
MDEEKKGGRKFKGISPELVDLLMGVLIRIIGESVKDRIIRAILIGALSAVSSYVSIDTPSDPLPVLSQK